MGRLVRSAGLVFLLLAACREPTEPAPGASIRIVRSPELSDTIDAFFRDSLIIEVRGEDGLPAANTKVDFASREGANTPGAFVETIFTTQFTDPEGRVRVKVRAGTGAGTARLLLIAQAFEVIDSLTFTIRPGALASVTLMPEHTVLTVGGTVTFTRKSFDRGGNQLPQVPVLVPFGEITVTGAVVTALGPGNSRVEARAGPFIAAATVDVVPLGKVAYSAGGQLLTRNLDGSGLTVLATGVTSPAWMRDGSILAIGAGGLVRVVPGGTGPAQFLVGAPADLQEFAQPSVSPDGVWVYFLATRLSDPVVRIYRASVNGTGTVALGVPEPVQQYSFSPDPQVLAYHTGARAPGRVYNLTNGAFFDFPPFQHFPWWSPQGDLIAFGTGDQLGLHIFTAAGQFVRTLHPTRYVESFRMSWAHDGRFILTSSGMLLRLVDLANGSLVELPFWGDLGASLRIP